MKLDEIKEMAAQDVLIDPTDLIGASIDTPRLANKYQCILLEEEKILDALESKMLVDYKKLFDFYQGNAPEEEYIRKNFHKKVLKSEIDRYINADPDYQELITKTKYQTRKVDYVKSIIRQLNNRSFIITNIINDNKFKNGGY